MSEFPDFQPYLKSICDRYRKWWQLYTLTDAADKEQKSKPELQSPFDFGLMVQPVKNENRDPREAEKERIKPFPVLEGIRKYAKDFKHVLLVGRPGAGKSTALARLLLEEATQQTSLPVLVELRYWQGSIEQLILRSFARHDLPLTLEQLETVLSRCLILFDGVNELPSEKARIQLSAFRRDHPKVSMIFTMRDLSLGGDLGIEKRLEMQPLTETQMQEFIQSYVPEQAEQMLWQLKDRLRELGQTPLLLWMLCKLFRQTGQIPENLGMVFRLFTQGYERNLKQDVVIESDRALWKPVLQQLAWVMMQGEKPTEFRVAISREEAVRAIAQFLNGKVPYAEDFSRKCLRDLQKYHLIQAGTNQEELEFRHQLIQEYYAGEALLERLPELDDEQLKREFLNFLKWTEPVALMLALIETEEQALRLIGRALEVDLTLGAELAGLVRSNFQYAAIALITSYGLPITCEIYLLGSTRSVAAVELLRRNLKHRKPFVRSNVIEALEQIRSDEAIAGIVQAIQDSSSTNRTIAIRALAEIGGEQAILGLEWALVHKDSMTRVEARRALESLFEPSQIKNEVGNFDDPNDANYEQQALDEYRDLEIDDDFYYFLDDFIDKNFLGKPFPSSNNIHEWLDILKFTTWLGKTGKSEGIKLLTKLSSRENACWIRRCAVDGLGRTQSSQVIPILIKALNDSDPAVSESAEVALEKLSHPKTLSLIKKFLLRKDRAWLLLTLSKIQSYCRFYDYELYQSHLEAQKVNRPQSQNRDRSPNITYNIEHVGNLNAGDTTIHGNQTGGQTL